MSNSEPLVSIVTPFYNTARYLGECIESVLRQSYSNFEYILVDNQSTDGGGEIARRYAKTDARVRVLETPEFYSQLANYNYTLRQISKDSRYCKMVQADDWIYGDCVREMVAVGEAHPNVAMIAGYELKGRNVFGCGLYPTQTVMPGRDACRAYLLDGICMFGSPNAVMYRADLVRERHRFYDESHLHADTELAFDLLEGRDFGIVHQVLSYSRIEDGSISGSVSRYTPDALDLLIVATRHGRKYLSEDEYRATVRRAESWVYGAMARNLIRGVQGGSRADYVRYQTKGLSTIGQPIRPKRVVLHLAAAIASPVLEGFGLRNGSR